jgi:hypothetical protein
MMTFGLWLAFVSKAEALECLENVVIKQLLDKKAEEQKRLKEKRCGLS